MNCYDPSFLILRLVLATVNDMSFNPVGCFWAVAGIVSTSYYQLFVKSKQQDLETDSFQLLKYQGRSWC